MFYNNFSNIGVGVCLLYEICKHEIEVNLDICTREGILVYI